jgi:hypothetical protein
MNGSTRIKSDIPFDNIAPGFHSQYMHPEKRGMAIEPVSKIFAVSIPKNREFVVHKRDYGVYALLAVNDF